MIEINVSNQKCLTRVSYSSVLLSDSSNFPNCFTEKTTNTHIYFLHLYSWQVIGILTMGKYCGHQICPLRHLIEANRLYYMCIILPTLLHKTFVLFIYLSWPQDTSVTLQPVLRFQFQLTVISQRALLQQQAEKLNKIYSKKAVHRIYRKLY